MDKTLYIQAYLQSQQPFLRSYATEGPPALPLSDNGSNCRTPEQKKDSHLKNFGFDTPLLKPRLAHATVSSLLETKDSTEPSHQARASAKVSKNSHKQPARIKSSNSKSASAVDKEPAEGTGFAQDSSNKRTEKEKKRSPSAGSDDEHAARLSERRERKRLKRSITKPVELSPDKVSNHTPGPSSKGKKGKKPSVTAAMALMHGFSAKNIGKSRLTLKPSMNVGVFGRGKASAKAIVGKENAAKRCNIFSEEVFLNSAVRPKTSKPKSTISSSSAPSSRCSSPYKPIRITNANVSKARKPKQVVDTDLLPAAATASAQGSSVEIVNPQTKPTAESEVWDIELENQSLPSGSIQATPNIHGRAASVVVDTRSKGWFNIDNTPVTEDKASNVLVRMHDKCRVSRELLEPHSAEDKLPVGCRGIREHDQESSLHPSHSASQVGQHFNVNQKDFSIKATTSKYFTRENHGSQVGPQAVKISIAHQVPIPNVNGSSTNRTHSKHFTRPNETQIDGLATYVSGSAQRHEVMAPGSDGLSNGDPKSRKHSGAMIDLNADYSVINDSDPSRDLGIVDTGISRDVILAITGGADTSSCDGDYEPYHEPESPSRHLLPSAQALESDHFPAYFNPGPLYLHEADDSLSNGGHGSYNMLDGDVYRDSQFTMSRDSFDHDATWLEPGTFDQVVDAFPYSLQDLAQGHLDDYSIQERSESMHEDFDCNQGEDIFDEQCYFEDNCVVDQPFLDEYQDDLQVNEYQPAIIENMDSYSSHDYAARPSSSCSSLQSRNTHDTVTSGGHRFFQGRALLLGISASAERIQRTPPTNNLSLAEADIAKRLRDHWRPQKF